MRQASVQTEIPVPEPDLTASEIIARADALKPVLRELQDDFERRGHPSADVHRRFRDAGFYRTLQPRRFGGYEFDVTTFWKAMLKVAEGDPGTGWFLTLASHHALVIGSAFS
ncbi:MAG TPA: acyl-CoA dehydrogenase, partial [Candidatus Binatia bacterium]|nr:acyl-CoA dehydrogenase [Candidatus Binatia bacterium]